MSQRIQHLLSAILFGATIFLVLSFSASHPEVAEPKTPPASEDVWNEVSAFGLSSQAVQQAVNGFQSLKAKEKVTKDILIVIDYTKSSNLERFFILNMKDTSVVKSLLVAHGRNTGNEFARQFSNEPGSYMSSLGFYRTAETYQGKHGLSLRLDGLERGINNLARERAIVIHQADYVSMDFAKQHGRIGRSLGCPALPQDDYEEVISLIKDGCLMYIYGNNADYLAHSGLLSQSS
jgi:hypothetical protein